jgi:hypothetical protein
MFQQYEQKKEVRNVVIMDTVSIILFRGTILAVTCCEMVQQVRPLWCVSFGMNLFIWRMAEISKTLVN